MASLFLIMNDVRSISSEWFRSETEIIRELGKPLPPLWRVSAECFAYFKELGGSFGEFPSYLVIFQAGERVLNVHIEPFLVLHPNISITVFTKAWLVEFNRFPEQWFNEAVEIFCCLHKPSKVMATEIGCYP